MKILTGILIVAVLLFSVKTYQYLTPIPSLENDWIQYTCLFIIHVFLILIVIARCHRRQSWWMGIDEKNRMELIITGLFGLSRNPILPGMILSTSGIFLILPNALTFFITAGFYILTQIQIRLEEEHLTK